MIDYKLMLIIIVIILVLFTIQTNHTTPTIEMWTNGVLILSRDDGIKHLSTIVEGNMTTEQATEIYDKLFDQTDLNLTIVELLNNYINLKKNTTFSADNKYYNKTYLAVADIINDRGISNGLPWLDNNALTPLNLSVMKKERLRDIYRFDPHDDVDFKVIFGKISKNYYINCDFIDLIKFNKYDSSIKMIIDRHPVLNAYKQQIISMLTDKLIDKFGSTKPVDQYFKISKSDFNKMISLSFDSIMNKIVPVPGDEVYKQAIANCIYNTLFVIYDPTISIYKLLDLPSFSANKVVLIDCLITLLNNYTLYISPNHDYSDTSNKDNLLNSNINQLNNILFNIRFYKDLSYLNNNLWKERSNGDAVMEGSNKVPILSKSQIIDILNILYNNYDGIQDTSINGISNIVYSVKKQNDMNIVPLDNKIEEKTKFIMENTPDLMFDAIFTVSNLTKCSNIPTIIKHIRTLIKKNYPDTPYDLILYKINRYCKIKEISDALIFGLY